MCCGPDLFMGLLAILFPPLAVWVKCGICSADSVINILLCMLGYIPGLLHAWYIIAQYPDEWEYEPVEPDSESGRGREYVYIVPSYQQQQPQPQQQPQQPQPQRMSYGTYTQTPSPAPAATSSHAQTHDETPDHAPPSYAEAIQGDFKIQL